MIMASYGLWTPIRLLLVTIAVLVKCAHSCPKELTSICECQQRVIGLDVLCKGINLNNVTEAIKKSDFAVARLTIRDAKIPVLRAGDLGKVAIRIIDLSGNQITEIEPDAFKGQMDTLIDLILANNSLSAVPRFGSLPKLKALNMNGNRLTDVAEDSLAKLTGLRQLRLERNKICQLSSNSLAETKDRLQLLDMSDNCLGQVPAQNLRNSNKLMYLDLSANRIESIPNLQFMNLPVLKEVRLNGNQISRMTSLAFMNVPELQYLYLRNNQLRLIEPNRYQAFRKLEVLDLTGNQIRYIPTSSFREVRNLKQLFLDNNLISRIDTLAFSADPKLQLISLQNNGLTTLYRNGFDSLDDLAILLLGNNSLKKLDRGMFSGMDNLQQLNLRNNSIDTIMPNSLDSVPKLTTLDLAQNELVELPKEAFVKSKHLFWLDLSDNKIKSFERGTFVKKIGNILLHNNPLDCDTDLDWLVMYLVRNNVRTFLPYQQEVVCASPEAYKGVRLKELMIKRANETFVKSLRNIGLNAQLDANTGSINPLLGNLLPGVGQLPGLSKGIPGLTSAVPYLGAITQAIPFLGEIPGLNLLPMNRFGGTGLDRAITDFASPLNRFATDGRPTNAEVNDFLGAIPNLVTHLPGIGNIDLSKVPPQLITHVLNGGSIPGVPREALDALLKNHMQRMAQVAARARQGQVDAHTTRILPPLAEIPKELVTSVLKGQPLPGLTPEQTDEIKLYYTETMPVLSSNGKSTTGSVIEGLSAAELLKFLPKNYDLTKLPPNILEAIAKGNPFDLDTLPADLLQSIRRRHPELFEKKIVKTKQNLEELLRELPPIEPHGGGSNNHNNGLTFRPYNIDDLDKQTVATPTDRHNAAVIGIYTAVGLGLIGAITIFVVGVLCYRQKHKHGFGETSSLATDEVEPDNTKLFYTQRKSSSSIKNHTNNTTSNNNTIKTSSPKTSTVKHFDDLKSISMHSVIDPYAISHAQASSSGSTVAALHHAPSWPYTPPAILSHPNHHLYNRTEI